MARYNLHSKSHYDLFLNELCRIYYVSNFLHYRQIAKIICRFHLDISSSSTCTVQGKYKPFWTLVKPLMAYNLFSSDESWSWFVLCGWFPLYLISSLPLFQEWLSVLGLDVSSILMLRLCMVIRVWSGVMNRPFSRTCRESVNRLICENHAASCFDHLIY
jgi:hypothetical protein